MNKRKKELNLIHIIVGVEMMIKPKLWKNIK